MLAAIRVLELARAVTQDDPAAITAMVGAIALAASQTGDAQGILEVAAEGLRLASAKARASGAATPGPRREPVTS